ncbi:CDP-alcohol phosphatidyltransferase family protein [Sphingobium sp. AN558]|uniref:CDP-alcohol phosphatidyltransferase family protein n=1 Tax=Sphingobium sp. AN558 TaxID=3133442 RepID=UPI0030C42F93
MTSLSSQHLSTPIGPVALLGACDTRIWGMSTAERYRRMIKEAAGRGDRLADGHVLAISLEHVFDPLLLREALKTPGTAFTLDGELLVGQVRAGDEDRIVDAIELSDGRLIYNPQLRKLETPFAQRLTRQSRPAIERRSYFGAYKGVTDLLTKYLWPELAFVLTRGAARIGMTPNMVTAIGALCCVAATLLFAQGLYWTGFLAGFIFMVLDTVDGKLARCTITSSKWGDFFDHGIDLVHPPFWWYAWGIGLSAWGLALDADSFWLVMAVILGGYVLQRVIEGIFMRAFGMHIHVWRRFDTWFRLITARRNPNMVILFVALLFGRPDTGLIAVAWWTAISLLVHGVQLVQAYIARAQGEPIRSWLETA